MFKEYHAVLKWLKKQSNLPCLLCTGVWTLWKIACLQEPLGESSGEGVMGGVVVGQPDRIKLKYHQTNKNFKKKKFLKSVTFLYWFLKILNLDKIKIMHNYDII